MSALLMLEVLWRLARLQARDRWTRRRLATHQAAALGRLRRHAYAHSRFYQRFHRGMTDRPLAELPILTKAVLMEHFDELVTDPAVRRRDVEAHLAGARGDERFRGRYWITATSGSTGRPGVFLYDRAEWAAILAGFARAHLWAGLGVGLTHRMRTALIASTTPWHMSTLAGASLRGRWMPALRLAATEPPATIVERLNAWQPEMLVAYPSVARVLADEQLAGRLRIAPRLVFTSSEVLTPETRRLVEAAWGRPPFNQYAATEGGGLAAECEHHGLHLFEDQVIVEVVDGDNRPVPPGAYGDKLLVTVLFSRTQPLIRYELTDSLRLATGPCACGRPFALIDDIQGRSEDILHLPGVAGDQVAVHPLLFHQLLDAVPSSGWQVLQEPDGLRVLLSGAGEAVADEALVEKLRRALADQGAIAPPIRVQRVSTIPRGPSGKAPLVRAGPTATPSTAAPLS